MRIAHISHSDDKSGAGIAARRISESLNNNKKIVKSFLRVNRNFREDPCTLSLSNQNLEKFYQFSKLYLERYLVKLINYNDTNFHSLSCFPSTIDREINKLNADIINLHWVQHEMMSIESIGRIKKPIIWTIHDAWPFSSTEHYPYELNNYEKNFVHNYIDNWCLKRKRKNWNRNIKIICPSRWLANAAKESNLMNKWDINVIPNPINTNIYHPINKYYARKKLNIPRVNKVIAYGAIDGFSDYRKGGDLLIKTLEFINETNIDITILIFGKSKKNNYEIRNNIKIIYTGLISKEHNLALIYSAADLMIVPSRQESFGQTASEAMSCGTPVICYNTSGLKDIVNNYINGIIIDPFKYKEMGNSIKELLNNDNKLKIFGENARKKAINEWSYNVVSEKYRKIYTNLMK